jgi:hypothetical protein
LTSKGLTETTLTPKLSSVFVYRRRFSFKLRSADADGSERGTGTDVKRSGRGSLSGNILEFEIRKFRISSLTNNQTDPGFPNCEVRVLRVGETER